MDLKELQQNWDELGDTDPLWAILSDPNKIANKWDVGEFFQSGKDGVAGILNHLKSLGRPVSRNRALDFGCGVGRLTQALGDHFDQCCGVDIAPSMIRLATRYNRHGDKCRYVLNHSEHLRLFEDDSFDLILALLVLQHMEPRYSRNYIKELLRILAPGGFLVIQLPGERLPIATQSCQTQSAMDQPSPSPGLGTPTAPRAPYPLEAKIQMYGVPKADVLAVVLEGGGRVVDVQEDYGAGQDWTSFRYCVTKCTCST